MALFDRARLQVLDGRIATGTRLTAEGDLAQALVVSHRMVFGAYLELRDAGYNSSAGYGARTIAPRAEQPLARYAPQARAAS
ncbi:hypothetical protein ITJ64_06945 [Herbiconiux sp. VKM Ac-1786]|uniref:hypothetical protein n=1 Tax=Herbiconiux sp. VKM Ac-1786 TaxID=2783824 RepID=UPI00188BAD9C|nr:hypothetical protein [Herbiconiux sp. VKM Ac-1786]MBF4572248.1 hypothetical protein [Herbiconiux sp. VKM Ac-1786]